MIENAFFACGRVRARVAEFGINRTAGANATSKISNLEGMLAPGTRVTLFRGVHPFQSTRATWWRGREENREFYTENKSPGPEPSSLRLRHVRRYPCPSKLFAGTRMRVHDRASPFSSTGA